MVTGKTSLTNNFPIVAYQEVRKRGLKVSVVGIPKTIDNDIPVLILHSRIFHFCYHFLNTKLTILVTLLVVLIVSYTSARSSTNLLDLTLQWRRHNVLSMQHTQKLKVLKMGLVLSS